MEERCMVTCPKCGNEVSNPEKTLENAFFRIESFRCPNCKCQFNEAYSSFLTERLATQ
jgi:transposase-like protein